jgi:ATP synthase protein I
VNERPDEPLAERVERYKRREDRAREESSGSVWRTIGRVGALGWLIALPLVLGAFLGHMLDERMGSGITWALGGMALGLAAGLYFLWCTIREVREDLEEP